MTTEYDSYDDIIDDIRSFDPETYPELTECTNICIARGTNDAESCVVMFIGQDPGHNEDEQGVPFVGKSGKALQERLFRWGLIEDDGDDGYNKRFHMTNVLKGQCPDDYDFDACAKRQSNWLDAQIEVMDPDLIVTVGKKATTAVMPEHADKGFTAELCNQTWATNNGTVLPIEHPASFMRSGNDVAYPDSVHDRLDHWPIFVAGRDPGTYAVGGRTIAVIDASKRGGTVTAPKTAPEADTYVYSDGNEPLGYSDEAYTGPFDADALVRPEPVADTRDKERAEEFTVNRQKAEKLSKIEMVEPPVAGLMHVLDDTVHDVDVVENDRTLAIDGDHVYIGDHDDMPSIEYTIADGTITYTTYSDADGECPVGAVYTKFVDPGDNYELDQDYVHLHVHTTFSVGDAYGTAEQYAEVAAEKGFTHLAITEHGEMGGTFTAQKELQKKGIKPIIGNELYVAKHRDPDDYHVHGEDCDGKDDCDIDAGDPDQYYHITALAKTDAGITNLNKLVTLGNEDGCIKRGSKAIPRVTYDDIRDHSEGLIILSGCANGLVTSKLRNAFEAEDSDSDTYKGRTAEEWYTAAEQQVEQMAQDFGDDFYIEVMPIEFDAQRRANPHLFDFADRFDVDTAMTFDVHFPREDDARARRAIRAANWNQPISEAPEDDGYWLKTDDEVIAAARDAGFTEDQIEDCIATNRDIAERCSGRYRPPDELHMPAFEVPDRFSDYIDDPEEFMLYLIDAGRHDRNVKERIVKDELIERKGMSADEAESILDDTEYVDELYTERDWGHRSRRDWAEHDLDYEPVHGTDANGDPVKWTLKDDVHARIELELDRFRSKNCLTYFLVVWEIVGWAKRNGIVVGPGRGSAGGSYVSYLIGILNIDALRHDLMFGRFLSQERADMPDIDVDFESDRRGEVLDYIERKYGRDHVAQIMTNNRYGIRGALRAGTNLFPDVAGQLYDILDDMPDELQLGYDTLEEAAEQRNDVSEFKANNPDAFETLCALVGQIKMRSKHAGGVVISSKPIEEVMAVRTKKGDRAVATEMSDTEELGLLKFDALGVKNLSMMADCMRQIREHIGDDVSLPDDFHDDRVYDTVFKEGNTAGIFQFKKPNVQDMFRRIQPEQFQRLVDVNALNRPGPLKGGVADDYIARARGDEPVEYLHPDASEVLDDTYGVILFQEQIMQFMRVVGQFSSAAAEASRKIVSKRKGDMFERFRERFVDNTTSHYDDMTADRANELFDKVAAFGDYGFNKIHSTEYATLAYWNGWLKAHYPTAFFAAKMSYENSDIWLAQQIKAARNNWGIELVTPDINASRTGFEYKDDKEIVMGLESVHRVGEGTAEEIMDNQPFDGFEDLKERCDNRVVHKGVVRRLIKAGAFDEWCDNRGLLYAHREQLNDGDTSIADITASVDDPESYRWSEKKRWMEAADMLDIAPNNDLIEQYDHAYPVEDLSSYDFSVERDDVWAQGIVLDSEADGKDYKGDIELFGGADSTEQLYLTINDGTGTATVRVPQHLVAKHGIDADTIVGVPIVVYGYTNQYSPKSDIQVAGLDRLDDVDFDTSLPKLLDRGSVAEPLIDDHAGEHVIKQVQKVQYTFTKDHEKAYARLFFRDDDDGVDMSMLGTWETEGPLPDQPFEAGDVVAFTAGGDDGQFMNEYTDDKRR